MKYIYFLNQEQFESANYKITGKEILNAANFESNNVELRIKINESGYEPVTLEEVIDLREPGRETFVTVNRLDHKTIFIDGMPHTVKEDTLSANKIIALTGKKVKDYFLVQLEGEVEVSYKNDRGFEIGLKDNAQFITYELEIIDVHEHCQNDNPVPPDCKYKILINRKDYVVDETCMTGKEILELTGETPPDRFQLRQKFKDGRVITIKNDQKVCFTEPGVEKFKTIACDQTEGRGARKEYDLLEEDEAFLNSLQLEWENFTESNAHWIFIYDYKIPEGYNVDTVTMGVRITSGYPTAQLDMLYFHPPLTRKDGKPIGALSTCDIDGKKFQQWSRHRTGANPWRPDIDNLGTHIPLADAWLTNEFIKRP